MTKNDGGPAFPGTHCETNYLPAGMSLRDYFAAAAMTAFLSVKSDDGMYADGFNDGEGVARESYCIADAMLAERAK